VLIKDVPDKPSEPVVTIIDFGLSRMEADGTTYYTDFEEAIFQGEGWSFHVDLWSDIPE